MKKLTVNEDGDVTCDESGTCREFPPEEGQNKIDYILNVAKKYKYEEGKETVY
jgi:hypothetical protein